MKLRLLAAGLASTIVAALFVLAVPVGAASYNPVGDVCEGNTTSSVCTTNQTTNPISGPDGMLTKGVNLLSVVVGILAVFAIMFAGFRFITAAGDAQAVATARSSVLFAVVGLVVVLVAQSIVIFVLNKL